ncbi:hypothetical protein GXP70_01445 [Paenibacillus lycopersici]|uniref:Uncharacterized protein n=1 Tax=Paenibacillus lycopersici TaxID=2704462 RepID=A0A6C0FX42_9BACL|nr:hypothetical protein [Paenibacillus lycopersici]QHT58770.1 hypothetical protein GXP70_01445 [Paenibacillus lycopersici]
MAGSPRHDFTWSRNTDTESIYSLVRYTGNKGLSHTDIMGLTAHAFRIIIDREEVEVGSYSFFDWQLRHAEALRNLGYAVRTTGRQNHVSPTPEELETALEMIHASLDAGVPALSWDLFIPEWGVIYGYDDEARMLQCRDVRRDGELPYEKLGRGEVTELYVLTITDTKSVDRRTMLKGALKLALEHAHVQQFREEESAGHSNGLAAFDAWIHAFERRTANPFGNAVNTGKVCDAREFAVQFLRELADNGTELEPEQGQGQGQDDESLRHLARQAAERYAVVAGSLSAMREMFPFPHGGEPGSEAEASRAIALLQEAKAAETEGVALLARMLELLERE